MKKTTQLFLAGIMITLGCSMAKAQGIIYSDSFNGGAVNINGTAPNQANSFNGGNSAATWSDALGANNTGALDANGIDSTTLGDSWTLPFTPEAGNLYTLTVSLTFTGYPGSWIGLGFAQRNSAGVPSGYGRFSDSGNGGPNGYDWMIATESSGNVQVFAGPHGTGQIFNQSGSFTSGAGSHTFEVILDTTSSLWSMSTYADGTQLGTTYDYSSNPTIGAVGITQNSLGAPADVQWNDLELTATPAPEPSAAALAGLGLVALFLVSVPRKQRDTAKGSLQ